MITTPDRAEAAEYYWTYINLVGEGDIRQILGAQRLDTLRALREISEERSRHRYAPDKWSLRGVLSHLNDSERVFTHRALWFARGFDTPLPSFDQTIAAAHAGADERSWQSHVEEFESIRAATLTLVNGLPDDAWARRGVASGQPVTVRALAYIVAGHVAHHMKIVRERYT
jgi:hypothetical protein